MHPSASQPVEVLNWLPIIVRQDICMLHLMDVYLVMLENKLNVKAVVEVWRTCLGVWIRFASVISLENVAMFTVVAF